MKITNNIQYNTGFIPNPKVQNISFPQNLHRDSFEFSNVQNNQNVSFGRGFLGNILAKIAPQKTVPANSSSSSAEIPEFHKLLSKGIKEYLETDIPAENLKSIMTPEEFRDILPTLTTDNFIAKNKNIENGTYFIDLDYESNFTKGVKENIFDILDNIAEFSDKYYKQTGKDFIFALADRDTLESLRHVIKAIGENPEKFEHMKLVPAVKISYAHEAPNSELKYENCNFLVYGINPFSKDLSNLMDTTTKKRKQMVIEFIRKVNHLYPEFAYTITEFAKQNKLMYERDLCISNLYWRAREYAETKGETAMKDIPVIPQNIVREAENIISQLGKLYIGGNYDELEGPDSTIIKDSELNTTIKELFEKYSTHIDGSGRMVSAAENILEDLLFCLGNEPQKPVIAYAAPYYLCHDFDKKSDIENNRYPKTVEYMTKLKEASKGMICAFQSVVPMYSLNSSLTLDTVKKFNTYIREHSDLSEVGGSFAQYDKSMLSGC